MIRLRLSNMMRLCDRSALHYLYSLHLLCTLGYSSLRSTHLEMMNRLLSSCHVILVRAGCHFVLAKADNMTSQPVFDNHYQQNTYVRMCSTYQNPPFVSGNRSLSASQIMSPMCFSLASTGNVTLVTVPGVISLPSNSSEA